MVDPESAAAMPIEDCEEQLRQAMLQGSVPKLEDLLSDDLIFTNQAGIRLSKADDLASHASGLMKIQKIDHLSTPAFRYLRDIAIVCVETEVAGSFDGQAFAGSFAYTRV